MIDPTAPVFELARTARLVGDERSLIRRLRSGDLERVRAGVYLKAEVWKSLDFDARYRARVYAASEAVRPGVQFCDDSAAVLWRLPTLGAWSSRVHALQAATSGGRSSKLIHRRVGPLDELAVEFNSTTVTSLARTVVDLSGRSTFERAVCMLDNALHDPEEDSFRFRVGHPAITLEALEDLLISLAPFPGLAKAKLAVAFADGASGSIGESLSRVNIHLLGFPPPLLQVPFYDSQGFIGAVDFYWPEFDLIGEFDGRVKYRDKAYLRGRLPEEVVWEEKLREDRLRRVVRDLVRWNWDVARDQSRLRQLLLEHGLPVRR